MRAKPMLYQELPRIDSSPLDGWSRWLAPALMLAAVTTAAVVLLLVGAPLLAALSVVAGIAGAALSLRNSAMSTRPAEPLVGGPDYSLVGSALGLSRDPIALAGGDGSLLVVNAAYRERFGSMPPLQLAGGAEARQGLELAQSMAWRDGAGCVAGIETIAGTSPVEVERVGLRNDLLLWRFPASAAP